MTTPHPYAEILHAIADGKEVQFRNSVTGSWYTQDGHATLLEIYRDNTPVIDYRIKPNTITIGGKELNAPMRVAPVMGNQYWVPCLGDKCMNSYAWADDEVDTLYLGTGLCFSTEADAKAVADAFLDLLKPNQTP